MGIRIAEQVRRALVTAAKVAPVAVVIDAAGCSSESCVAYHYGAGGLTAFPDAGGFTGSGGTGTGGVTPRPGCSKFPDCDTCVTCAERCLCPERMPINCIDWCEVSSGGAAGAGGRKGNGGRSSDAAVDTHKTDASKDGG
jgi:hypothetical protein